MPLELLRPEWGAPAGVVAAMSTRRGGVSVGPFESLNLRPCALGGESIDYPEAVAENQRRFSLALGANPVWLDQVHGADVVRLRPLETSRSRSLPRADASVTTEPRVACAVLVADCLPVLICSADGRAVGAAHAGWRGLAAGVLERALGALCEAAACTPAAVHAWLGPCIGPQAFEVGPDVLSAFGHGQSAAGSPRFVYRPRSDGTPRWLADLAGLARDRLAAAGVRHISGGDWCTVADPSRFFSFRRDGRTGRMAAAIAILR